MLQIQPCSLWVLEEPQEDMGLPAGTKLTRAQEAALWALSLFQQQPKGPGINKQIIMNKTSGGLFFFSKD